MSDYESNENYGLSTTESGSSSDSADTTNSDRNGQYSGGYDPNGQYSGGYDPNNQYNYGYNPNGQYSGGYDPNGQYSGGYDPNNQYNYGYNMYGAGPQAFPVDKKGRPLKNRFGLKLTLSIIELIFSPLFGILAIIFTCLQGSKYSRHEWKDFKTFKTLSKVFIWLGYIVGILMLVLFIGLAIVLSEDGDLAELIEEAVEEDYQDDEYYEEEDTGLDLSSLKPIDIEGAYQVTYEGADLSLPAAMSDIMDMGTFDFETDPSEIEVEPGYTQYVWFGTDYWEVFFVENDSDQTMTADQLSVSGVSLVLEEGDELSWMDGKITQDSTSDDVIALLGDDYGIDSGTAYDEDEIVGYCWNTGDGYVEFWFEGDTLYTVDLEVWTQ